MLWLKWEQGEGGAYGAYVMPDVFVCICSCHIHWISVIVIRNTNDKLRLVKVVRQLKALG